MYIQKATSSFLHIKLPGIWQKSATQSMATHLQNKISVDVAADKGSADSLSFAGLICIQDQQSKSTPIISTNQIKEDDPEFEFSHTRPHLTATDPIKYSPPDLLISNGRNESCVVTQSSRGSLPTTRGRSRRPGDNTGGMRVTFKPNHEVKIQANKERTAASSGFGRKLFQSFVSPCRQCRAITPTTKAHTAPRENLKWH